jgi:hypothetical protein
MALEEFKSCAVRNLGDQVEAWDEVVLQNLIAVGRWWKSLDDTVQLVFGPILGAAGAAAARLIGGAVGVASADLIVPVIAAFAVGAGIGAGLLVIADCADDAAM